MRDPTNTLHTFEHVPCTTVTSHEVKNGAIFFPESGAVLISLTNSGFLENILQEILYQVPAGRMDPDFSNQGK